MALKASPVAGSVQLLPPRHLRRREWLEKDLISRRVPQPVTVRSTNPSPRGLLYTLFTSSSTASVSAEDLRKQKQSEEHFSTLVPAQPPASQPRVPSLPGHAQKGPFFPSSPLQPIELSDVTLQLSLSPCNLTSSLYSITQACSSLFHL